MSGKYDDIINMPHHVSRTRRQMSLHDRAAQFSPFAALTGHKEAIDETARFTECYIELDDGAKAELNSKLNIISEHIKENPSVLITYFQPDELKEGGEYVTISGQVRKTNNCDKKIIMCNGLQIPFDALLEINGEIFDKGKYND